jgi:hypothetical protein
MKTPLDRRHFLRAIGMTLALPVLESLPVTASVISAGRKLGPAKRLVCVGANLGLHAGSFYPKESGSDYGVAPLLKPLMQHKDRFTLISGLDHRASNGHKNWDNFLCGKTVGDVSLDQIAAKHIGADTRIGSLQLSAGKGSFRQKMVYNEQGIPVPMIKRPSVVYQTLFGLPDDVDRTEFLIKSGKSSLDSVSGDAKRLQQTVSSVDREKLGEYFQSVRDLEQRMERQLKGLREPRPKVDYQLPEFDPIAPTLMLENQALMYDLMALALETDSTRVITMFLPGLGEVFTINGETLSAGYHALSHHGNNPGLVEDLIKVESQHMALLSGFLDQLKRKTDTEEKPLLDSTLILWGAGMGDASRHSNANLPIFLAGGGLKHGSYIAIDRNASDAPLLGDLYVTMLQQLGIEQDRFSNASRNMNQYLV